MREASAHGKSSPGRPRRKAKSGYWKLGEEALLRVFQRFEYSIAARANALVFAFAKIFVVTISEKSLVETAIQRVFQDQIEMQRDFLAVEEPLEIRLVTKSSTRSFEEKPHTLSISMRTPGHDFELAAGFLFAEGIVQKRDDLVAIRHVGLARGAAHSHNIVQIELARDVAVDFAALERFGTTTSSCGVCGKASIRNLQESLDAGKSRRASHRVLEIAISISNRREDDSHFAANIAKRPRIFRANRWLARGGVVRPKREMAIAARICRASQRAR